MLDENTSWVSEVEGATAGDHAFIAADGQRFTGSSEVVQFPSGRTAQLSVSAD